MSTDDAPNQHTGTHTDAKAIADWLSLSVLLALLAGTTLWAQVPETKIELSPPSPTASDTITYKLSGIWWDGCVPQSPMVSLSQGLIRIETSNPHSACTLALAPWNLTGSLGKLAAGDYLLVVTFTRPSVSSPFEIGRKSFTVAPSSSENELFLPIVVNGSIATSNLIRELLLPTAKHGAATDRLHYQTLFTILNGSKEEIQLTLQVYSNSGDPGGVFCSPLAPPPSRVTMTLRPDAQSFQFTSADLPFLNGWAVVRWKGSGSVLVSSEVTLANAAPSPCLLICNHPSTEKVSSAQIPGVKPATEFRLPVTLNAYRQTALALINPSSTQNLSIKVTLLDVSGGIPSLGVATSFEERLKPLERASRFLWQMVQDHASAGSGVPVPDMFQGTVILTSEAPFAAGALHIMFPEGKFVNVPVFSPVQ